MPSVAIWLALAAVVAAGCGALASDGDTAPAPSGAEERDTTSSTSSTTSTTSSTTTTSTTTSSTTTTTTTTQPTTTTTTTTTVVPPAGPPAPGVPTFTPTATPTLHSGDEGDAVRELEQRLVDLGYRPGPVDGSFTATTGSAVLAFQKREGISRDRVVGPQVWAHLQAPSGAGPKDASTGVEVDLDRQVAFVMVGDGSVTTINISSGSGRTYQHPDGHTARSVTPTGSFSIVRRIDGVRKAPLGELYRPLYFSGGFAIHGSPSVPAYPASHGCVRTSNTDQDWLFPLLPNGTRVVLYGGSGGDAGTDTPAA